MGRVWRVAGFILCLLAFGHCSRDTITSGKGETLVIVVGGLGADQTTDVVSAIKTNPAATVISASSWDGYKADIPELYRANQKTRLVLIGHSFGAEAVVNACKQIAHVDTLILIDPVAEDWGQLEVPPNVDSTIVFYRTEWFGPKTAKIKEGPHVSIMEIQGGHNDIPHDAGLIQQITMGVK